MKILGALAFVFGVLAAAGCWWLSLPSLFVGAVFADEQYYY